MGLPQPGKYFIHCQSDPTHRTLDLPSQYAHKDAGLVHAIASNRSEYQKWMIEPVPGEPDLFTIRSSLAGGRYLEPDRGTTARALKPGEDRNAAGLLLCFFTRAQTPYQMWRFEEVEEPGVYYIANVGSGKYLDLRAEDPSHIQQLEKKDAPNQRWILRPAG